MSVRSRVAGVGDRYTTDKEDRGQRVCLVFFLDHVAHEHHLAAIELLGTRDEAPLHRPSLGFEVIPECVQLPYQCLLHR